MVVLAVAGWSELLTIRFASSCTGEELKNFISVLGSRKAELTWFLPQVS